MFLNIDISSPFFQFGGMLVLASIIGLVCYRLKKPLFFAYLATGVLVGVAMGGDFAHSETIHLFSELGIAFLLFLIGMEFNLKDIRHIGKIGLVAGLGQIAIVGTISFSVAVWFGLAVLPSIYVALAMTFASMVISVKYLNDHQATETLYGKVDLMMHLVQSVVAVLALMVLSTVAAINWQSRGDIAVWVIDFALLLTKGALLLVLYIYLSQAVLPKIFKMMAGSTELLVLGSVAWCVFGAGLAYVFGFSVEVGAFLAGLALSSSGYQFQVTARIKPIRDFFVVVFFIGLGIQVTNFSLWEVLLSALVLSAVVLVLNPLVSTILLSRLGYKRHTAFFASILMNQIGEFSVILAALGVSLHHLSAQEGSLITTTVLLTMLASSYVIDHQQWVYKKLRPLLAWLERSDGKELRLRKKIWSDHVVVLGAHRLGSDVLDTLRKGRAKMLVVDYDPDRVALLEEDGYAVIYGDAVDESVLEEAGVSAARLIISTIDDDPSTRQLLRELRQQKVDAPVVVTATTINEALDYYRLGAAYVIIPMLLGGKAITQVVKDHLSEIHPLEPAKLLHLQHLAAEGYLMR